MSTNNHIAIIGMSGKFPGANNIDEFWQLLIAANEGLKRLSREDLLKAQIDESEWEHRDYVPVAGMLDNIDYFAADFFGFSPREAELLDPQQRLLLEHAWFALEDAAIDPYRFKNPIGVFVGSSLNTYLLNNILNNPLQKNSDDLQQILFGNGTDYLATRIAYLLNLKGAAINIQTACSTSLVAVHEACQYLLSYQVDLALAGGVSIAVPEAKGYRYQVDGMLSKDGHCKPFSSEASGTVFSSGLGMVVLKRLDDALADQDAIYAVIKGSAINNDGHQKVGYTAPSIEGQSEVIALAQGIAEVTSNEVSYIETHGTATNLGDLIELSALKTAFHTEVNDNSCALGSLKSNIGHLDVAAGVAGLIKTALALKHKQIPATLYASKLNQAFAWDESPFYVNDKLIEWKAQDGLRHAGVSSFGIGGTNAHVVVGEFNKDYNPTEESSPVLLVFSAKTVIELKNLLKEHANYAKSNPNLSLSGMARTLQEGRAEFNQRAAIVVSNLQEFIQWVDESRYSIVNCTQKLATVSNFNELEITKSQWLSGHDIDWDKLYLVKKPTKLHLPNYPMTRTRHWIERAQDSKDLKEQQRLPMDDWFYVPSFKQSRLTSLAQTTNNCILMFVTNEIMSELDAHFSYLELQGRVILVYPGQKFARISATQWIIDKSKHSDFIQLLENLKTLNNLPTHVVHAWTLNKEELVINKANFDLTQGLGLLSLIELIKAWETCTENQELKLSVLTNHLNRVAAESTSAPHKAPLLAAVKVIPKEFLKVKTQLLDLDLFDVPQAKAFQWQQVVKEICKENYSDEEIVYRGLSRWVRDYVRTPISSMSTLPKNIEKNKVIVITGGLGQLGLDIAEYFAEHFKCRIALLARREVPAPEKWDEILSTSESDSPLVMLIERIKLMRSMGAEVVAFAADVEEEAQLKAVFKDIELNLGPISGLVHAAGETINGIISLKTEQSLQESYAAKVYGTYHLWELLRDKTLDFCILCSSMNSIIGGLGQLDNTAANAFIDYMAEYMVYTTGQNIFAINWGAVNVNRPMKVNVLQQFMELSTEHKKNRMSDAEVNEIYHRLLSVRLGPRVVISTIDMQYIWKSWNEVASLESLGKVGLKQEYDEPLTTDMERWVKERFSQLLGIEDIGINDDFFNMGGHSLAAVQFISKVRDEFNINTHVMNLYEMPTIKQFSEFLEKKRSGRQAI